MSGVELSKRAEVRLQYESITQDLKGPAAWYYERRWSSSLRQFTKDLTKDCQAIIVHLFNNTLCHVQGNSDTSEEVTATCEEELEWSSDIHAPVEERSAK